MDDDTRNRIQRNIDENRAALDRLARDHHLEQQCPHRLVRQPSARNADVRYLCEVCEGYYDTWMIDAGYYQMDRRVERETGGTVVAQEPADTPVIGRGQFERPPSA